MVTMQEGSIADPIALYSGRAPGSEGWNHSRRESGPPRLRRSYLRGDPRSRPHKRFRENAADIPRRRDR